jgi:hypothetical protein
VHTIHWLSRKANEFGIPLAYYFDINNPQNHSISNSTTGKQTSHYKFSQSTAQEASLTKTGSASSTATTATATISADVPYCTSDLTTTPPSLASTHAIHSLSVIVTNNPNNRTAIEGSSLPASSAYSSTQQTADPYYSHSSSPNENAASTRKLSGCLLKKKYVNNDSFKNSNSSEKTISNESNTTLSHECQEMSFIYRSYNQHQQHQHNQPQQYIDTNGNKCHHSTKDIDKDNAECQHLDNNQIENVALSRKANDIDANNSIQMNIVNSINKNGSTKNAPTFSQSQSPRCFAIGENNSSNYHGKTVNRNSHDEFELIDSTVSPISTNSATSPHLMSSSSSNANTTNCSSSVCNSNTNLNHSSSGAASANGSVQVIPTRFIDRRVSTSLIQSDPYKFNVNYFEAGQRLAKKAQEQLKSLEKTKDLKTPSN